MEQAVLRQIEQAAREAKLAGFEVVRRLALDHEAWSVENGLLTPTFKVKREQMREHYQKRIEELYAQGAPAPRARL